MKRIVTVIMALAMLTLAFPAFPALGDSSVGTEVTINQSGALPSILVKWEQDLTQDLEDGDPTHTVNSPSNSQFLPPMVQDGAKTIQYFAVPDDASGLNAIQEVFSYVFSPNESPPPYDNNPLTPVGLSTLFKYKVQYHDLEDPNYEGDGFVLLTPAEAQALFDAAYAAGLVVLGPGVNPSIVSEELGQGVYHLWGGEADLTYEQPAGEYQVDVYSLNKSNQLSPVLPNTFTYVGVPGLEVDFTSLNYGAVSLGMWKPLPGDTIWGNGPTNNATVRNIGNVWSHPVISQDDMGFGQANGGAWNVQFGARVDTNPIIQYYSPQWRQTVNGTVSTGEPDIVLTDYIELSTLQKLDFYIQVNNVIPGKTTYTGTMTISAQTEPFFWD